MKRAARFGVLACLLSSLAGCAWMYSAPVPLRTERYPAAPARASTLLVLMPGRGDSAGDWAAHGFVSDLRAAGLTFDVVATDATIGYYMKETIVDRMRDDVLAPARAQGYKQIWIVGASMGGLGSLIIASRLPGAVDRVVLLSPYLGPNSLISDIAAAGGPARWKPTYLSDPYQRIWQWLRKYTEPGAPMPQMWLGFARQEGMASNHRLLAQILPADRVFEVDGKHGWVAWRQLWQQEFAGFARGQ